MCVCVCAEYSSVYRPSLMAGRWLRPDASWLRCAVLCCTSLLTSCCCCCRLAPRCTGCLLTWRCQLRTTARCHPAARRCRPARSSPPPQWLWPPPFHLSCLGTWEARCSPPGLSSTSLAACWACANARCAGPPAFPSRWPVLPAVIPGASVAREPALAGWHSHCRLYTPTHTARPPACFLPRLPSQADELLAALAEGSSSQLLADAHVTLLRLVQADMGACMRAWF